MEINETPEILRTELEPAFAQYQISGPLATGSVSVLGGSLPLELIDSKRGGYYCVVPARKIAGERPYHLWVVQPDVQVMEYRDGYFLAVLDPMLAMRVLEPVEAGTLWERRSGETPPDADEPAVSK